MDLWQHNVAVLCDLASSPYQKAEKKNEGTHQQCHCLEAPERASGQNAWLRNEMKRNKHF